MQKIIITSPEELKELIQTTVQNELGKQKNNQPSNQEKKYLNVSEAAEYVGVAKQTLYAFSAKGDIPSIKRAKHLLFLVEDLDNWLMEGKRKSNSEIKADIERGDYDK